MQTENESLGERIRRRRKELGLSLAKIAGGDFSRAFLHQVEHGQSQPSVGLLRLIAKRLDLSLDELVEGEDPFLRRRLVLEKARLELALDHPERAEQLLSPLEEGLPGRVSSDIRVTLAMARLALGESENARRLLDREEQWLRERGEKARLAQLMAVRKGKSFELNPSKHQQLAAERLKAGDPSGSLEHLRQARIIAEYQAAHQISDRELTAEGLAQEVGSRC